jgi:cytosine/adenosine deaminase-related metal-dependent hydrolase
VHLDPAEAELLRESGATVAHNPRSNMNNGVGRTPLGWLGERVALGTDGIGSDIFEESRAGYLRRREEDVATGADWALRRLATGRPRPAGRAFGEPLLGRLVPGAPADLVVLDYAAPTPLDGASLAGHWIFGLSAAHVRDVVVAGEVVVRGGGSRGRRGRSSASVRRRRRSGSGHVSRARTAPFAPARLLAAPIGGT